MTSTGALELVDVGVSFAANGTAYNAISDINLTIAPGEFVCVVGPTGCGKSTLLNVAAGLMPASRGAIRMFGIALRGLNSNAGYMFQAEALMPWRNARDNVAAGLTFRGVNHTDARAQADNWLARVGLRGFGERYPHQLSGGMRKRVALAQMLVLDPKLLLMDEPFAALDVHTRSLMENELLEIWSADRKSVIFITHDLEEAIALGDRVVVLSAGPASRIIGDYRIDLPRPRDVAEARLTPRFVDLQREIWRLLKTEVQKSYRQA